MNQGSKVESNVNTAKSSSGLAFNEIGNTGPKGSSGSIYEEF